MTSRSSAPPRASAPGDIQEVESGPGVEIWRGQQGVVALTWTRNATRLTVGLHGQAELAPMVVRKWEQVRQTAKGPMSLILDFGAMPTYDSKFRIALTEWGVKNRNVLTIHLLSLSKLVNMGATVANIALGGIMTIHNERPAFERAAQHVGLGNPPKVV